MDDILGINRRNIDYIMNLNKREHFALVDDKITTKKILGESGIPIPFLISSAQSFFHLNTFIEELSEHQCFALKPARGYGGGGIVVVKKKIDNDWVVSNGTRWDKTMQTEHIGNILYGVYSIDNAVDTAFAEEMIIQHPDMALFAVGGGIPDIRIIMYMGEPKMAMLRAPTKASNGKSNLHSGGFAVSLDISTGCTGDGWINGKAIHCHPEMTKEQLRDRYIPNWDDILSIAKRLYPLFPLGYLGADFVVDAIKGPLVLELNARPGLEIQNVNKIGLRRVLHE